MELNLLPLLALSYYVATDCTGSRRGANIAGMITSGDQPGPTTVTATFIRGRHLRNDPLTGSAKPHWLKVRAPGSSGYRHLKRLIREHSLNTVCEEANCPNIGECWHHGTATFMILGGVCTRACAYCNVTHGRPGPVDVDEPKRIAKAVQLLGLDYAVITSVDRDDLDDGGASAFAETITATRTLSSNCRIEVLVPDFGGRESSLDVVLAAAPDVLNHNIETVPRLYRSARPGGNYSRALKLLHRARRQRHERPTKSGLMVGLGETWEELVQTLTDLREVGCGLLTIGQYLRPSLAHLPVCRYYHPDEFAALKQVATTLGFGHVESGPLVRSSYHAHEQADAFGAEASSPAR